MTTIDSGFVPALSLAQVREAKCLDANDSCISFEDFDDSTENDSFSFGDVVSTADGECLKKETFFPLQPRADILEETVRMRLSKDLTLVPGIGKIRESELKRKGFSTISSLKGTRFSDDALEIADILENGSVKEICNLFAELKRSSEPLLLGLMSNYQKHLYFDIETLGMAHAPIILFGVGEVVFAGDAFKNYSNCYIKVTQYLLRDIDDELPALMLTKEHFKKDSTVVTYNGKCFDIPYLNNRLAYYGEREVNVSVHADLLHPTRRLFSNELPNCRLETVESHIPAFKRGVDIPGYLVPVYYQNYLRRKDISILRPVVEHNTLDVANLSTLLTFEMNLLYG